MTHRLKKGVKIFGVACSTFNRLKDSQVTVIGVIYRGSSLLEGVLKTKVKVDGENATEKIAEMIFTSPHKLQLKLILTRGVTIAGFNFIDLEKLFELTSLPVISVVDRKPNMDEIFTALKHLPNGEKRFKIIEKNGPPRAVKTAPKEAPVYVQSIGLAPKVVEQLLRDITIVGRIPEPIRVARLIAIAKILP